MSQKRARYQNNHYLLILKNNITTNHSPYPSDIRVPNMDIFPLRAIETIILILLDYDQRAVVSSADSIIKNYPRPFVLYCRIVLVFDDLKIL